MAMDEQKLLRLTGLLSALFLWKDARVISLLFGRR